MFRQSTTLATLLLLGVFGIACSPPAGRQAVDSGEATGRAPWTLGAMVVAANPYATDAAAAVLERGGHAVDAAIAAHAVLGLVEPQSSGLGGGGLMLVYERASDSIKLFDGRETAPAGISADLFVENGEALGFLQAWQSGRSIGVPGVTALYKLAHDAYGRRPWAENFQAAIDMANDGFVVSERLSNMLGRVQPYSSLDERPGSAEYFFPNGDPLPVGYTRDNPDYARTLSRIAAEGIEAFYSGEIAAAIVEAAQAQPLPGTLTLADLDAYAAKIREPLCGRFYATTVCSTPAPGSGAGLIAMLGLYERMIDGIDGVPREEEKLFAFVDAQRLGYADRDHFIADTDFVPFPNDALFAPEYLDRRVKDRFKPADTPTPGNPLAALNAGRTAFAADSTWPRPSTTHMSIVDREGNAVSFTATVEAPFGSSRWVGGFLLNNQLTDFAREPGSDREIPANVPAPGKRPRSSMSPAIVFDADGQLTLISGSPGGNSIIAYTFKSLLGALAWGDDPGAALARPNIVARGSQVRVESSLDGSQWAVDALTAQGYPVALRDGENSGVHLIQVTDQGLKGAADPRREGQVKHLPPDPR